jgi:hypothetical protein
MKIVIATDTKLSEMGDLRGLTTAILELAEPGASKHALHIPPPVEGNGFVNQEVSHHRLGLTIVISQPND